MDDFLGDLSSLTEGEKAYLDYAVYREYISGWGFFPSPLVSIFLIHRFYDRHTFRLRVLVKL